MFDVAFSQLTTLVHHDVAHIEVGVTRTYTLRVTMIKAIALCRQQTFGSLDSTIDVQFPVRDDELWRSRGLEGHLASATLLYSPVIFAQNEKVGVLVQFPVNFWVVVSTLLEVHTVIRYSRREPYR